MLNDDEAETFAARAIAAVLCKATDDDEPPPVIRMESPGGLPDPDRQGPLAPGTSGMAVAEMVFQVHGGMGFNRETGAAQYAETCGCTGGSYEGTNGISGNAIVAAQDEWSGARPANRLLDESKPDAKRPARRSPNNGGRSCGQPSRDRCAKRPIG